jgi:chromate transporter
MKEISLKDIFLVFLKMGAFAFGGVYSMLAFFEKELVRKRKWLSHEEFAEGVVIGQLTPGAPIVNTGIFIGYTLRKLKGALATVAGQVLPSFFLVLIIAYLYIKYSDIPLLRSILKGIGAAVVGLVASVVYSMGKKFLKSYKSISFAVLSFVCLAVFRLNPIAIILISGFAGLLVYRKERSDGNT